MEHIPVPLRLFEFFKENYDFAEIAVFEPPEDSQGLDITAGNVLVTAHAGVPIMRAYFQPSKEDIEALQEGGWIELAFWSAHVHPFNCEVRYLGNEETLSVTPVNPINPEWTEDGSE